MKRHRITLLFLAAITINFFYAQEQSEDNIFSTFEANLIKERATPEDSMLQEFAEVVLKKGEPFLQLFGDLLQIRNINTYFLAEMIVKYPNRFQKDIITQSQKKNEIVDDIVCDTLFSTLLGSIFF